MMKTSMMKITSDDDVEYEGNCGATGEDTDDDAVGKDNIMIMLTAGRMNVILIIVMTGKIRGH